MPEAVCQVIAYGDESHTALYRHAVSLRLCPPVVRRMLPTGRESSNMECLAISGLYCSGIHLEYNAESSSPRRRGSPGQYGPRVTGYNVALLRSTNFLTFFCPDQTLTSLTMSISSRSTWEKIALVLSRSSTRPLIV